MNDIRNINDINEGKGQSGYIRNPRFEYLFNGLGKEEIDDKLTLSLACQAGTDMLHTVGNITAVGLQFMVDQFPTGTFNTVLPATKLAHRQLRHTPKQILSQPYPMCIVNPRVSLSGNDNRMAAGSFATTVWSNTSSRFQNRSEMPLLLYDKQKGIEWRGKHNRVVVYLDFVLSFQSMSEQIRWASYLLNKIPTYNSLYFDIDTALELAIPDGFMYETSKYIGIPVKDDKGNVSKFMDYLNMHSVFPIIYRFSSGRHTDAFYTYYTTSILCSISDVQYQNVTKVNKVEADCPITFTMRCEFNTIGMFDLSVLCPDEYKTIPVQPNSIAIPIFSDCFNEKDFPLAHGWKILSKPICKMDWGETEVDISPTLPNEILELIDTHVKNHMDPNVFISVKLRENKLLIDDGYYVDWNSCKLVFTNCHYASTYRLIISINQLYIQSYMNEMYNKNP